MTARRLYTENEIITALNEASRKHGIFPATGTFLKELRGRGEPVLFTKEDLLDVGATPHEKLMIHGIFSLIGMDMANEAALMSRAREANLGGNMAIVIGLAKAKKDENLTPGRTYASADGYLLRRVQGGKWRQYILDPAVRDDNFATRPLREI